MAANKDHSQNLAAFTECLKSWKVYNDQGANLLAQINLDDDSNHQENARQIKDIVQNLKQVLETMHEKYNESLVLHSLQQTAAQSDITVDGPECIETMRKCIDMHEQEYMIKKSIQSILCQEGFATRQHLTGCIALWKTEAYLDDEVQEKLRQLSGPS
ncbi:uncharacterized protein BYT42DRAFT_551918 [Radiomyces spectabilis]|uniref:uncharacterized protein n=1 Tax=Radiomyces spectabilis TaxID=64574 RepID=UPI00221FBEDF|nr:uncharacterized protein BYT42DRAFT_551918 [Radiomyces spectabilis]KAI8393692.1 hypothetical protein BYT42DRAFT_551918 [Radiomyces spectabilis]